MQTIAVAGGDYGLLAGQNAFARYQATNASGQNISSSLNGQHVITTGNGGTYTGYVRAVNYGTTPTTQEPVIGSTLPKFLGSWQNSFTYKRFTLTIFLDSRFGGIEYSNTIQYGTEVGSLKSSLPGRNTALGGTAFTPLPGSGTIFGNNLPTTPRTDGVKLNGVFQQGSSTMGQDNQLHNVSGMTYAAAYKQGWVQPDDAADYYVTTYDYFGGIWELATFKSDWIVVRDISLGYDLPSNWATKMKLNSLRAVISVRNPFYLLNRAQDKINPDNTIGTGSGNAFDAGGIPYIRTYGFSINGAF
jgi:iron complex outermembrane receptor protein